ncbi:MAG: DUF6502 family protein [Pseudomonadota bacterium]
MPTRPAVVLCAVLRAIKPLARLLLRHGVAYPAFASALKQLFLEVAADELNRTGKKQTDSALSLLSGVHRRDVRALGQLDGSRIAIEAPMNMASEVASRWLTASRYQAKDGQPLVLPRSGTAPSFEALVAGMSSDVRPRAVLDELVRLGMADEAGDKVRLLAPGFVPREGFPEMASLLGDNLHDHACAAALNLEGGHNYLEQAVFSQDLTADSVQQLHRACAQAWREQFKTVMRQAQARFEHDRLHAPASERIHRVRFGAYFFASDDHDRPS